MRAPALFILLCLACLSLEAKPPKGMLSHPDGFWYSIIRAYADTSSHPVFGDYIFMHLIKVHPDKREVFNTHIFNTPEGVEFLLDQPAKVPDVTQAFTLMNPGDSAVVMIPASKVDAHGSSKKYYTFYLKLINFKPADTYLREKAAAETVQRQLDSVLIGNYLITRGIGSAISDNNGIVYSKVIGNDGALLQAGDTVKLHYKGVLTNGYEFDNSYNRNDPLVFVLGARQVIDGLDWGLRYFRKGESGTILIPSRLGYATREVGKIPANSVLIFDIEILP